MRFLFFIYSIVMNITCLFRTWPYSCIWLRNTCRTLLEKQRRAHKWCTPMDPPHMAELKQDGQLEHTYSSYVRIRDVALKTCQRRWTIGRSGERGSGISVLAVRHYDDDDDWKGSRRVALDYSRQLYFYLYKIMERTHVCVWGNRQHVPWWTSASIGRESVNQWTVFAIGYFPLSNMYISSVEVTQTSKRIVCKLW